MTILWKLEKGRDQIVARLIRHDEASLVWEIRLSFNGSRFHSRNVPTLEKAGAECEFLQRDYLGRGWVVVEEETVTKQ